MLRRIVLAFWDLSFSLVLRKNCKTMIVFVVVFIIQYLEILLDDKLSWKYHKQKLHEKLSKLCGLFFKLRQNVLLFDHKLIYYSTFQSTLLYSLINWGRAAKSYLHYLEVLQNTFTRASLILPKTTTTNLLYLNFQVLTIKDMVKMENVKFKDKLLRISFVKCFTNNDEIHENKTRQKFKSGYYHIH